MHTVIAVKTADASASISRTRWLGFGFGVIGFPNTRERKQLPIRTTASSGVIG